METKKNLTAQLWLPCVFLLPTVSRCELMWTVWAWIWHGAPLHQTWESQHTHSTTPQKVLHDQQRHQLLMKRGFRGKNKRDNLWQRGELTFNLSDFNVHVHFVTWLFWNVIKKFQFVFDVFVKIWLDVYSNNKRGTPALVPHRDVQLGESAERSQVWFSPAELPVAVWERHPRGVKVKCMSWWTTRRPFSVAAQTDSRCVHVPSCGGRAAVPGFGLMGFRPALIVLVLRVTVLSCGERTSDWWH